MQPVLLHSLVLTHLKTSVPREEQGWGQTNPEPLDTSRIRLMRIGIIGSENMGSALGKLWNRGMR